MPPQLASRYESTSHRFRSRRVAIRVDAPRVSPFAKPWCWYLLATSFAAVDQLTKLAVSTLMPYGQNIPLTGFFNLVHVWNTGAAFSFLADAGGWQRYFFIVIAFGVSIVLVIMLRMPRPSAEALGYSLVLGGALGNGFDSRSIQRTSGW